MYFTTESKQLNKSQKNERKNLKTKNRVINGQIDLKTKQFLEEIDKNKEIIKTKRKSPVVACLLNLVFLGCGFLYLGQVSRGFKYLIIAILLSWTLVVPVIMLIMAMTNSYKLAKLINSGKVDILAGQMIFK